MDLKRYKMPMAVSLSVPVEDLDRLLSASDGGACLLYLYILRNGGEISFQKAAKELKRTEKEIEDLCKKLVSMELISQEEVRAEKKLRPSNELPEYSSNDLVLRTSDDNRFQAVLSETQRILGRVLSTTELKTLFGIYDYLALPAEVMLMLVNHCVEECREHQGPGRLPTMRRIQQEAYNWSDNEVLSLPLAEEHIKKRKKHRDTVSRIKEILQIRGRELSKTESNYVESWISMGFSPDALDIAYDKTVTKTGNLQWRYMNTIIESWHEKGLHTPEEIEKGDKLSPENRFRKTRAQAGGQGQATDKSPQKEDLERMKKILDKVRNG